MEDNIKVPILRFNEFNEAWLKIRFGDIVERISRKNKNNEHLLPLTISSQYGLISQVDFFNKVVAAKNLENYYLILNGEFAYNKSYSNGYPFGSMKRLEKYDMGVLSTLYICFKPIKINSDFLKYYLETSTWHKEISMIVSEGARNHGLLNVSIEDFFNTLHVISSNTSEQQKIASFLSLIDKQIEKQSEKITNLENMKKGLMQKIFSQEIRFKDKNGQDYPEWIETTMVNLLDEPIQQDHFEHLYVEIGDVDCSTNTYRLNKEKPIVSGAKKCSKNTILVSTVRPTRGAITLLNHNCYVSSAFAQIYIDNKILRDFIFQLLLTNSFLKELGRLCTGSTYPTVSINDIMSYKIILPSQMEMQKIGQLLSKIDDLIIKENTQLQLQKQLKKGLLQQMFI